MSKILLILLVLLTALYADVSLCTDNLKSTEAYISCIKEETNKTDSIQDINFVAGYLVTKNDFDNAIIWYKKSVKKDDAKAMYYLGGIFEEEKKEYEKAVKWFKKAADKKYKDAVYRVGSLLEKELNKEKEAISYYKEWIKKGNIEAYNYLGNLYLDKENFQKAKEQYLKGADKDSKESYYLLGSLHEAYIEGGLDDAMEYYEKGAELGDYKSTFNLAANYDKILEYDKAEPWYKKSMAMGNKDAYNAYGYALAKQHKAKESLKIFQELADLNDSRGYVGMAKVYVNEYKDYKNEKKYALKAIKMGNADGALLIGYIYSDHLKDKDFEEAIKWYTKAYEMGSCSGVKNIAVTYKNDFKDENKYNEWLDKADAMGCGFSGFKRGYAYYVKKDYKNAIKWYKRGAELGDMKSASNLGIMYQDDLKNNKKAIFWYNKAYTLGNKKAKKWIKKLEAQQ